MPANDKSEVKEPTINKVTFSEKDYVHVADVDTGPGPLHLVALLLILGVSSHLSQSALRPFFGPALSSSWFIGGSIASILIGSLACPYNLSLHKYMLTAMAVIHLVQFRLAKYIVLWALDNVQNLELSPLLVHAVLGFPLLGLGGGIWFRWMEKYSQQEEVTVVGAVIARCFGVVSLTALIHYVEWLVPAGEMAFGAKSPGTLLTILGITTIAYSTLLPSSTSSRSGRTVITSNLLPVLAVIPLFLFVGSINLEAPAGISIVTQAYGTTGFLQVGDVVSNDTAFRYLRRDTGIVGFSSLLPNKANLSEFIVGDPVQPASLLGEAAFLATDAKAGKALIIGVGTGVATKYSMAHGFNTTVLESDNTTYNIVRDHFALTEPDSINIVDPSYWVYSHTWRREVTEEEKFDVVIHNSFLGEIPSADTFTLRFWQELNKLLKDDSVVAITFTGRKDTITFKIMLSTALSVFGTCRVFQDGHTDSTVEFSLTDFVILCTPMDTLKLRAAKSSDYSGSSLRKSILTNFPKWEIDVNDIVDYESRERLVLKEQDRGIKRWGQEFLLDHWRRMRTTLPKAVWAIY